MGDVTELVGLIKTNLFGDVVVSNFARAPLSGRVWVSTFGEVCKIELVVSDQMKNGKLNVRVRLGPHYPEGNWVGHLGVPCLMVLL